MKKIILSGVLCIFTAAWSSCTQLSSKTASKNSSSRYISSVTDLQAPWAYDGGPDPKTAMGKELIDIVASQPNMPMISSELTGGQTFRPAFGPTLWRMIQEPDSIKILFIGQDGTHIAEAAGRTATAGFGGRAQDMAAHFGVITSAAFMNTFAFTIKGQYSGYGAPVVTEENGVKKVSFDSVVDNGTWLMAQDQNSPMVKWRNRLISWIIRNNRNSMKLIVLFGGSAEDTIGSFVEANDGKVGSKYYNPYDREGNEIAIDKVLVEKKVKVPVFRSKNVGGNKEIPMAITKNEQEIYEYLNQKVPYNDLGLQGRNAAEKEKIKVAELKLREAQKFLNDNIEKVYPNLAITNGGLGNSGIIHPAQIGGYDVNKIYVNGQKTISLKGLKINKGTRNEYVIENDILVAQFPHPTSLSSNAATASEKVEKGMESLQAWKSKWSIEPDQGQVNKFQQNQKYKYGRSDIAPAYYDFGTPANRMVSVSSASRLTGNANVIIIGTRDRPNFDMNAIKAATNSTQPDDVSTEELFTARPRTPEVRYVFDRGPGEKMARIMKENLNMKQIGLMKDKKSADESCRDPEPASNFNIKTHPICVGDFGHYRGTFNNPKVIILADPDGLDDILTSRALTGTRGQYLHGLMKDMGVDDNYLVIKTVPFGMDGATDTEWSTVLSQTSEYRQRLFDELLKGQVQLVLTDGKYAAQEITKLLKSKSQMPRVSIVRNGTENSSGIKEAAAEITKSGKFNKFTARLKMTSIPRSHLGFFSRVWEGTSGTRVFDTNSASDKGTAFAIVAPKWAYYQKSEKITEEVSDVDALKAILENQKLPRENEKFEDFLRRRGKFDGGRIEKICEENCSLAA